ncbi:MAG: glycosyltransferase, partial [Actinomycetota bacterium]
FGGYELQLRQLWHALSRADLAALTSLAESGDGRPLDHLVSFLASGHVGERYWRRIGEVTVEFPGRLDHGPLSRVLPTFDALVVPSVVPEAFGMVAAEAAACGVLPIVPRHSGIGEIGAALEEEMGRPGLLSYDPAEPVEGIAAAIDDVLELPLEERRSLERVAVRVTRERWSWEHVAQQLLDLALDR